MMFLAYARENWVVARRVLAALTDRGEHVARDPTLLKGDAFWRRSVRHLLERCRSMLVVWSAHAARSPWVDQEIRHFGGRKLLVRLDDAELPEDLGSGWVELPLLDPHQMDTRPPASYYDGEAAVLSARRACLLTQDRRLTHLRREMPVPSLRVESSEEHELRLEDGTHLIRLAASGDALTGPAVFVAATPVTNRQYSRFLHDTGYQRPPTWSDDVFRRPDAPVVGVTWFEACAYVAWAGAGLPSRDEWMRAASGGDVGVEFATADGRMAGETAHFGRQFGQGSPVAVGKHPPNPGGFYGMSGNTWDWCSSREGPHRVICGGGYMDSSRFCRTDTAYRSSPIDRDCCVGFRIKLIMRTPWGA